MRRLALVLLLLPTACGGGDNMPEPVTEANATGEVQPDRRAENRREALRLRDEAKKRIDAGDFSGAADFAEQAVKLAPEEPTVHDQLGFAYQNLLRYDDALESYARALELFDGKHSSWLTANASYCAHRQALEARDKGDTEAALAFVRRAIELKGGDPALHRLQGSLHFMRQEFAAAAEAYGVAADTSVGSDVYSALSWMGQAQFRAEDWRGAYMTFTRIINDGVDGYEAHGWRGHCDVRLGWLDDAEVDFRQALDRTTDPAKKAEYENALKAIAEAK